MSNKKQIMLGNQAIARGAYEAGVKVSAAYPGTPSTEISENIVNYKEIYAEWSPNEKVAMEVAIGASISGVRSLVSMKHVGVNVAADPLFTVSYIGVNGGLQCLLQTLWLPCSLCFSTLLRLFPMSPTASSFCWFLLSRSSRPTVRN